MARQQPHAVPQLSGLPNLVIQGLVDVNFVDILDGGEPSIALNPENPKLIVIHGGFFHWGDDGSHNASVYVLIDGGTTWNRTSPINPPPGGEDAGAPYDTTIYYGANSQLFGSFRRRLPQQLHLHRQYE